MKQRIVVIGGGFGGLQAAKKLAKTGASITLLDKNNHSLFQPFLYQVAASILAGEQIGIPFRTIFRKYPNVDPLMAEVKGIDLKNQKVFLSDFEVPYDYLVVASGVQYNYFGRPDWKHFAPSLKSIDDANYLRSRILGAFEKAETEIDPNEVNRYMTMVLVGGGPTGVEMAGALAAITRLRMVKDFRHIKPEQTRIVLLEAGPTILKGFKSPLPEKAKAFLEEHGVEVRTNCRVTAVDEFGVCIEGERIEAKTVIWTAGVEVPNLRDWLQVPTDRVGKVIVEKDLSIPGHKNVFVIGDACYYEEKGTPLPGVAQVAIQQGKYVGRLIRAKMEGKSLKKPFHYFDKGNMAVIGKMYAIADLPKLRLSGFFAWIIWAFVHVVYNFNLRNRIAVVFSWFWTFFSKTTTVRLLSATSTPFQTEDTSPQDRYEVEQEVKDQENKKLAG
jgi:NADH:ubiquinone reductase (H+-translocating)